VTMANVAKMMEPGAIGKMFPDLAGMTPVISGFGWWQGWNDGCDLNSTAAYEQVRCGVCFAPNTVEILQTLVCQRVPSSCKQRVSHVSVAHCQIVEETTPHERA
jgi:hypothetical protein